MLVERPRQSTGNSTTRPRHPHSLSISIQSKILSCSHIDLPILANRGQASLSIRLAVALLRDGPLYILLVYYRPITFCAAQRGVDLHAAAGDRKARRCMTRCPPISLHPLPESCGDDLRLSWSTEGQPRRERNWDVLKLGTHRTTTWGSITGIRQQSTDAMTSLLPAGFAHVIAV